MKIERQKEGMVTNNVMLAVTGIATAVLFWNIISLRAHTLSHIMMLGTALLACFIAMVAFIALRPHDDLIRVWARKFWIALDQNADDDAELNRLLIIGTWFFFGFFLAHKAGWTMTWWSVLWPGSVYCFVSAWAEIKRTTPATLVKSWF